MEKIVERRPRSRRGHGAELRTEILDAAARLIDISGNEETVTLRGIAREVGIAAPSIYGHFPDREAVIEALMVEAFRALTRALQAAAAAVPDDQPVERLLAGCLAYLRFASEQPQRYRVLFDLPWPEKTTEVEGEIPECQREGLASLQVLIDGIEACVAAGVAASTDPYADAVAIWVSLHGLANLSATHPNFLWPDRTALADGMVRRLAQLDTSA